MTGRYYERMKVPDDGRLLIEEGLPTIASVLKSAGYRTAAIGKWHLGFGNAGDPDFNQPLKPGPLELGFDYFFGTPYSQNEPPGVFIENHGVFGLDPADPLRVARNQDGLKNFDWGSVQGGAAALAARPVERIDLILADKAVAFLESDDEAPFFLYVAFVAPHMPVEVAAQFQGASKAGSYGDFVQQLDYAVGQVLDALERRGLDEETLVIFTSDNGGRIHERTLEKGHRTNGPWLGQKTDAWEGGHRIPFIARGPGRIPAGTHTDALLGLNDLLATFAGLAGTALPQYVVLDSLDQMPVLLDPGEASAVRTEMLLEGALCSGLWMDGWVYLPQRGSCGFSVPDAAEAPHFGMPWDKLGLVNSDLDAAGEIRPDAPPDQLYDMTADPGQSTNVVGRYPQRAAELRRRLNDLLAQ